MAHLGFFESMATMRRGALECEKIACEHWLDIGIKRHHPILSAAHQEK